MRALSIEKYGSWYCDFLQAGWSRVHFLVRQDFLDKSRLALWPTQPLAQSVPGLSPGVQRLAQGFAHPILALGLRMCLLGLLWDSLFPL